MRTRYKFRWMCSSEFWYTPPLIIKSMKIFTAPIMKYDFQRKKKFSRCTCTQFQQAEYIIPTQKLSRIPFLKYLSNENIFMDD